MDFSAAQDQARRTSKKLVLLFLMSVLSLIIITNLLVAVALLGFDVNFAGSVAAGNSTATNLMHYLSLERFGKIALAVCGVVGCAIAYKWVQLSGGGKRVAEQLGGQALIDLVIEETHTCYLGDRYFVSFPNINQLQT